MISHLSFQKVLLMNYHILSHLTFHPSLLQASSWEGTSHEDANNETPAEAQDNMRDSSFPCHKLCREIKDLQTFYNPIPLEAILHAHLLPADFILNAHDES
jgi:hypothetical protein